MARTPRSCHCRLATLLTLGLGLGGDAAAVSIGLQSLAVARSVGSLEAIQ